MNNLALVSLIFFLVSCSGSYSESQNTISIDIGKSVDRKKLGYSIGNHEVIPLETVTKSIFGRMARVEFFDEKFFILDITQGRGVFVFTKSGKFLGRTKFGAGPDEMIDPFAFYIDKQLRNIVIWDQTLNMLITYDFNLSQLSKKKLDVYCDDINKVDDIIILHAESPEGKAYRFNFYTEDFRELLFSRDFLYETYDGGEYLNRSISIADRTLLITPNDYNIYQLNELSISSEYYLDFGSDSFSKNDFKKGIETIWQLIRDKRKVSFPIDVFESKSFVGFRVMYGLENYTYLISRYNQELILVNDLIALNNLPKCIIRGAVDTNSDILYGTIDSREFMEYFESDTSRNKMVRIAPKVGDNPYMIFLEIEKIK